MTLINPRGRVITIELSKGEELLASKRGFIRIQNPKEVYYPQYDQNLSPEERYKTADAEVLRNDIEADEYLPGVEII